MGVDGWEVVRKEGSGLFRSWFTENDALAQRSHPDFKIPGWQPKAELSAEDLPHQRGSTSPIQRCINPERSGILVTEGLSYRRHSGTSLRRKSFMITVLSGPHQDRCETRLNKLSVFFRIASLS